MPEKSQLPKLLSDYLAEIGKKGGKQTSEAKQKASRENGKKGGRPKGSKNKQEKP